MNIGKEIKCDGKIREGFFMSFSEPGELFTFSGGRTPYDLASSALSVSENERAFI